MDARMKSRLSKLAFLIMPIILFILPAISFAQTSPAGTNLALPGMAINFSNIFYDY